MGDYAYAYINRTMDKPHFADVVRKDREALEWEWKRESDRAEAKEFAKMLAESRDNVRELMAETKKKNREAAKVAAAAAGSDPDGVASGVAADDKKGGKRSKKHHKKRSKKRHRKKRRTKKYLR